MTIDDDRSGGEVEELPPPGVERAYVATGTEFADALTGGMAAAVDDTPVLLVAHDEVPGETAEGLDRFGPDEIRARSGRRHLRGDGSRVR